MAKLHPDGFDSWFVYHCPVMLMIDEGNRGPCPQRMLKCSADLRGYHHFVCDQ